MKFPKPPKRGPKPKKPLKRSRLVYRGPGKAWIEERRACRGVVMVRDRGRCRCCGKFGTEVHEEPSRAHGGDPLNPDDCVLVCRECHRRITGDVGLPRIVIERGASCADVLVFREGAREWRG